MTSVTAFSAAEIGLGDRRVASHLVWRACRDLAPEIQHVDMVGDVHHDAHLVLDHHHRDAEFVANIEHEAGDIFGLLLVHARHHFVEQQQPRFAGQRAGQLDALLLAIGQRADMASRICSISRNSMISSTRRRASISSARVRPKNSTASRTPERRWVCTAGQDVFDHRARA